MRSTRTPLRALAAATLLTLTACGGGDGGGDAGAGGGGGDGEAPRIAAVFSGVTTDADYTFLGLEALEAAEDDFGAETTYSESVAVPDAERVLREYVADGYTVVWTHGSQFYDATVAVAAESPDVIVHRRAGHRAGRRPRERLGARPQLPPGLLPAGRARLGASARAGRSPTSAASRCRSPTPRCTRSSRRWPTAAPTATLNPVWTGDFNDPTRAGQFTSQLLADGNDVVLTSLNLGAVGAFEAVSDADGRADDREVHRQVQPRRPTHYLTSVIYDFTVMLDEILTSIEEGETGGYLGMTYEQGISLQEPTERRPGRRSTRSTRWSRTSRAARSRSSATSRRSNEHVRQQPARGRAPRAGLTAR